MKRALFVFAPMALVGCGPNYDRTDITNQITVTANAEVSKYRIVVTKNTAAKAHIESFDSSSNTMRNDVASLDTSTLDVKPAISDHDYVFLGLKSGFTTVTVMADGDLVLKIDALVVDQPP